MPAQPDKTKILPLTLENFPQVAALVAQREELRGMVDRADWLPEQVRRVVPAHVFEAMKDDLAQSAVVKFIESAIGRIDAELVRYGFTGLSGR